MLEDVVPFAWTCTPVARARARYKQATGLPLLVHWLMPLSTVCPAAMTVTMTVHVTVNRARPLALSAGSAQRYR
jgi:hypothetical protein